MYKGAWGHVVPSAVEATSAVGLVPRSSITTLLQLYTDFLEVETPPAQI